MNAPDGTEHTVQIEWVGNALRRAPKQLRGRVRRMTDAADVPDVGCLDELGGVFAVIAVVAVLVFLVIFVGPVALGLLEILVILVLGALVWVVRVLFRRPWSIVHRGPGAAAGDEPVELDRWRVVGWREAHRVMVEAAESVEASGRATVTPPVSGWA